MIIFDHMSYQMSHTILRNTLVLLVLGSFITQDILARLCDIYLQPQKLALGCCPHQYVFLQLDTHHRDSRLYAEMTVILQ